MKHDTTDIPATAPVTSAADVKAPRIKSGVKGGLLLPAVQKVREAAPPRG